MKYTDIREYCKNDTIIKDELRKLSQNPISQEFLLSWMTYLTLYILLFVLFH